MHLVKEYDSQYTERKGNEKRLRRNDKRDR